MKRPESVLPFLKWPGGKRWAAPTVAALVRDSLSGTYYEPFLGGGAVFFCLRPERAVLSDINTELTNVYVTVRDRPGELLREIEAIPVTSDAYYRIRAARPQTPLLRAAYFLYLNRTAFGGIYRLNLRGEFNVPYGGGERTPAPLWGNKLLAKASAALQGIEIKGSDFEPILEGVRPGDVVYCDPTYTVVHDTNGFIRYNERNFSWADQKRLAAAAHKAVGQGASVIVSNGHHDAIARLYPQAQVQILERKSLVSPRPSGRQTVREYLFTLRPD